MDNTLYHTFVVQSWYPNGSWKVRTEITLTEEINGYALWSYVWEPDDDGENERELVKWFHSRAESIKHRAIEYAVEHMQQVKAEAVNV